MIKCPKNHDMPVKERSKLVDSLSDKISEEIIKIENKLKKKKLCPHVLADILMNLNLRLTADVVMFIAEMTGLDPHHVLDTHIKLMKTNIKFESVSKRGMH